MGSQMCRYKSPTVGCNIVTLFINPTSNSHEPQVGVQEGLGFRLGGVGGVGFQGGLGFCGVYFKPPLVALGLGPG